MDQQLLELNQKFDQLANQVSYLTVQAEINEQQRERRDELFRDLVPIANQAFHLTIEEFEEIQDYIDLGDLLRFFKRILRNGRTFEKLLDQLESVVDLIETLGPLSDEAMSKLISTMANLEQKGYFQLAKEGVKSADRIINTLNNEDNQPDSSLFGLVRQLGDEDVRRGLAISLRLLKAIGQQTHDQL